MSIQERYASLTATLHDLKKDYEKEIVNKELPLQERWELFCTVPLLHNRNGYIVHFKCFPELDDMWYDDLYVERYAIARMVDIVERLEDDGDFADKIPALKEEILETNMGSFVMDW